MCRFRGSILAARRVHSQERTKTLRGNEWDASRTPKFSAGLNGSDVPFALPSSVLQQGRPDVVMGAAKDCGPGALALKGLQGRFVFNAV